MAETADSKSSTDLPRRIVVGRVSGAHGLRGNLNVRYFGGDPESLLEAASLWLADGEDDPDAVAYEVVQAAPGRSNEVRMHLSGVDDRSAAESLKGRSVLVDTAALSALPEGEYYSYQLVGCRVELDDGRPIGTVAEIWSTGAPDIFVVEAEDGRQHLIPAAQGMLREVDIELRRIVVELPPGLIDID